MKKNIVIAMALAASTAAWGQDAPSTKRAALEGHWTLKSVVNELDGVKSEPLGKDPLGLFIFDRSGRYAIQLYKPGLPPIAANDRYKGTDEEYRTIVRGSLSHYGTFTVDEKAGTFTVRAVAANYPNWIGKDQPRKFSVKGSELTIQNPSSSGNPNSKSYLILHRAK